MNIAEPESDLIRDIPALFPGEDVSFVGECPWYSGYTIGTDHGQVKVVSRDLAMTHVPLQCVADSREAINSIAFGTRGFAVSTRTEIAILDFGENREGAPTRQIIDWGSHGVLAGSNDLFLAALGREGLLIAPRAELLADRFWIGQNPSRPVKVAEIAWLGQTRGRDQFAVASGHDGVIIVEFAENAVTPSFPARFKAPNIDIVSVCSLRCPGFGPGGFAALSSDSSIHLRGDISGSSNPVTLRPQFLSGHPYAIRRAGDHLIIHTNKGFYVLIGLARIAATQRLRCPAHPITAYAADLELVDVQCPYDWIALIGPDSVLPLPLAFFDRSDAPSMKALTHSIPTVELPGWNSTNFDDLTFVSYPVAA